MRLTYQELLINTRERLADFIGADDKDEVVLVPNASHGINNVLRSFEWQEGDILIGSGSRLYVIFWSIYLFVGGSDDDIQLCRTHHAIPIRPRPSPQYPQLHTKLPNNPRQDPHFIPRAPALSPSPHFRESEQPAKDRSRDRLHRLQSRCALTLAGDGTNLQGRGSMEHH